MARSFYLLMRIETSTGEKAILDGALDATKD